MSQSLKIIGFQSFVQGIIMGTNLELVITINFLDSIF